MSLEMPVDISNVLLYCNACKRGVRVGFAYKADGSKVRLCRKCRAEFAGAVSPPRAKYAGRA